MIYNNLTKIVTPFMVAGTLTMTVQAQSTFTPQQTKDIETIVREYLLKNPEILIEVSQELQLRAEQAKQQQIANLQVSIFDNPAYPVMGNPNGTTVLAEFSDYQCGFCKRQHSIMMQALANNPDVKLVMLEFPALGPTSVYAAKAALAARIQGKYKPFNDTLMKYRGRLTPDKVDNIAQSVGVNVADMKQAMNTKAITDTVKSVLEKARALGVTGTPTIIGKGVKEIRAGLLDENRLNTLIMQTRKASKAS